jgi:3-oxoadipate enol-lactonase
MATVPTILGDLYVDDQGNADEAVALLWPSLFTDHSMWRYQIPALRSAGWRTLALDPPGHGRSKGLERDFTMDECAEAAIQVLDALNVHSPVVVLGTSWGGMIAPRVALRAPDRVRGIVLFNTTAESATLYYRAQNTLLTKMLAISALDKLVDRMIVSLQLAPETRRLKPELGAELSRNFRSWNRRGVINSVRAVLVDRDSTLDALRNVKTPALVVSGKEDTILVPLEAPDAANTLILDFVAKLTRVQAGEP